MSQTNKISPVVFGQMCAFAAKAAESRLEIVEIIRLTAKEFPAYDRALIWEVCSLAVNAWERLRVVEPLGV